MVLGNLIFRAEVIEQRFGAIVLPIIMQQTSDVTFSTPTSVAMA
jgi:hypothetical protein